MRWRGRRRSENVEDRRGGPPAGMVVGGGGLGALLIVVIAMFLGADPQALVGLVGPPQQQQQMQAGPGIDDDAREFIEVVLSDTETIWSRLFQQHVQGGGYSPPRLVMFTGSVQSGCGVAAAQMGPFYCPADQQVYIDPTFFDELKNRHNAPGDFANAYVIAHEVAHHVQKLLGFSDQVAHVRQRGDELATNRASVRLELQADYLAGVWAHHAHQEYNILEEGDIAEAMNAANQIGDDTLQRLAQGHVVPERFTHGTSEQRVRWFKAGLLSGDMEACKRLFELDYSQL
ncbi:MAG: neutral zinc metallopeptidase [Planctomycetales bacterium]|nr:neutral zinc metallopeptidase [Planctomycetales bacterium]